MLYRIARAVAEAFKFVAFGGFIAAFFTAFAFVFILPIVPLFLIISAPFVLVLCWITSDLLSATEQALARRALRANRCPACHTPVETFRIGKDEVRECAECRRVFLADGDLWQRDPDAPDAVAHPIDDDRTQLASS